MKELGRNQQIIMALGSTLMVIGVGCFVFGFLPKVFSVVFMVGAVCFATMQMIQASSGDSKSIAIRRLKGIMVAADICFILAGLLMLENSYMVLYKFLSWETWLKYCWNNWVVALLIAAILELYTSHRISNELKKNN
jgi:hypothetical protein